MNSFFVQYQEKIPVGNIAGLRFTEEADFNFDEVFEDGTQVLVKCLPCGFFFSVIKYDVDCLHRPSFS
jgi:hypothetical protein